MATKSRIYFLVFLSQLFFFPKQAWSVSKEQVVDFLASKNHQFTLSEETVLTEDTSWLTWGQNFWNQHKYIEAKFLFENEIELEGESAERLMYLARSIHACAGLDNGESFDKFVRPVYQDSLKLAEGNDELKQWVYYYYAHGLLSIKMHQEAIDNFNLALGLAEDFAFSHFYKGVALFRVHHDVQAEASLQTAIELFTEKNTDPLKQLAFVYLAEIDIRNARPDAAKEKIKTCLTLGEHIRARDILYSLETNESQPASLEGLIEGWFDVTAPEEESEGEEIFCVNTTSIGFEDWTAIEVNPTLD